MSDEPEPPLDSSNAEASLDDLLADLVGHRNVERMLEVFVDREDAAVTVLDAELRMLWISRRGAVGIMGDDPMQHEGRPARDFIHPDDVEHAEAELRRAARGETIDYRSRATSPGSPVWVPMRNVGWGVDEGTDARVVTVTVIDTERDPEPRGDEPGPAPSSRDF